MASAEINDFESAVKLVRLAIRGELPLEVFLRDEEDIPALRLVLLLIRWIISGGIVLRFWINREFYNLPEQRWQLSVLVPVLAIYLLYTFVVTALGLWKRSNKSTLFYGIVIVFDIVFCSVFYYLTGTEESDFFLFYLLPIFVIVDRSNFRGLISTMSVILLCFAAVLVLLSPTLIHPLKEIFLKVFFPRALFLAFTGVVALFLRQTERVQRRTFMTILETLKSGFSIIDRDLRVLWINQFERDLITDDREIIGAPCHRVFHSEDDICPECPLDAIFHKDAIYEGQVCHRVGGEDRMFGVVSYPLRDQNDKIIAMLSVTNEVTAREKRERSLSILPDISNRMRVAELENPDQFEEILWRVLAGVVAEDGLGFERSILLLFGDQSGFPGGGLGLGPLDEEEGRRQWKQWEDSGLSLTYEQIGAMRGDPRIMSGKLNRRLASLTLPEDLVHTLKQILSEGNTSQTLVVGEALWSTPPWDGFLQELPGELEVGEFAVAPLFAEDDLIGILWADNVVTKKPLLEEGEDVAFLQSFANQAAILIESARVFSQAQGKREEAELLYRESLELFAGQRALPDLLLRIVEKAAALLNAKGGSILLCTPWKEELHIVVTTPGLSALCGKTMKYGSGVSGKVVESRETLFIPDYHHWEGRDPQFDEPPYRELFDFVVGTPLFWEDKAIGVLTISNVADGGGFSEVDVALLERFADAAAYAIGNASRISRLNTLLHNSPDAIIAVDPKGKITAFNDASQRMTEYPQDDIIGMFVVDFYYDGITEARRIMKLLRAADERGEPVGGVQTYIRSCQGERVPIRFTGSILRDDFGEKIGSIGLMTDLREIDKLDAEYRQQQEFLTELSHYPQDDPINTLEDLQGRATTLLKKARRFCQVDYFVLFASVREDETVLQAVAWDGLPSEVEVELPHYNWRKADLQPSGETPEAALQDEVDLIAQWQPDEEWRERIVAGIRGPNADFFANLSCGVPVRLADNYRGVLVFGPFETREDLLKIADLLRNTAHSINTHALSWLQALYLRSQRKELETTTTLIIHRERMYLSQVMGKLGAIKRKLGAETDLRQKADEGEDIVEALARAAARARTTRFWMRRPEDYEFRPYLLATLVQNCVDSFRERAMKENRTLVIDPGVDNLHFAQIDPTGLSVALGNLIDNALKYSKEGTQIHISSEQYPEGGGLYARITVEDEGEKMTEDARQNLIEPGRRWTKQNVRDIPGSGFGLWEASAIAAAHGGKLDFSSVYDRGKSAHVVKVWLTLPLQSE